MNGKKMRYWLSMGIFFFSRQKNTNFSFFLNELANFFFGKMRIISGQNFIKKGEDLERNCETDDVFKKLISISEIKRIKR